MFLIKTVNEPQTEDAAIHKIPHTPFTQILANLQLTASTLQNLDFTNAKTNKAENSTPIILRFDPLTNLRFPRFQVDCIGKIIGYVPQSKLSANAFNRYRQRLKLRPYPLNDQRENRAPFG